MAENSIGPGTVLAGRFRLEDLLSDTDGAKCWRATDRILARSVAVHVVALGDPRAGALLDAARASATVTDGHFLRVLDAAEEDPVAYVVNEWGVGSSLDLMLTEGPLPPRRAAWLVKEVADAITTAHRNGVAHGRLIPENVMVTEAGSVKVIGFVVDAALSGTIPPTQEGGGTSNGQASDVVNLASLLYATLVGRWPGSEGSGLPEAPREHGRPLRPRQVRAGVPRALDAICERALNPDRHQPAVPLRTAHEVSAALSDFIGDPASMSQVGHEPTAVISRPDLPETGDAAGDETTATDEEIGDDEGTGDEDTTRAQPAPPTASGGRSGPAGGPPWSAEQETGEQRRAEDPEPTQAGAPLFFDDDSDVGWAGLRSEKSDAGGSRSPSPPPPLPQPEPRPLFAADPPGPRRTRTEPEAGERTTDRPGQGTGSLPPVWGPDTTGPEPAGDSPGWEPKNAGKSWLRLAAVVAACLLLLLVVILAFNLGRGSGDPDPSADRDPAPAPAGEGRGGEGNPVDIAGVRDFDPQADPPEDEENPDLVDLAVDGDPTTAWQTLTYFNDPQLGGLKDGVGLLVDLGEPVEVSRVQLRLIGEPTSLELLAADEGAGAPTSTDGLDVVATAENAGTEVDLELEEPVTTRYLVVWLTSLPPAEGDFVGQIAEIDVES